MRKKISLRKLLIVLGASFAINASAQSPSANDAFATMDENQLNVFTGTFTVMLSDTVNVSQIEIKLGTSTSASDIVLETFNYDVTTGLPSGRSYSRTGKTVILGIGTFSERNTWFGEARIKDTSGNWSSSYTFIFN